MSVRHRLSILFAILTVAPLLAQTQWPWPVTPFNSSQLITGNFCEYRSTSADGHFHNGTDIPKADGSPVYPVKNGTVTGLSSVGSNAYVRVDDIAYVHIVPNPNLSVGSPVVQSQTVLGTIYPGQGHVHLTNGYVGSERNSMLPGSGLTPYDDPWPPVIRYVRFFQNGTSNELQPDQLFGLVDIMVKVDEANGPPGSSTSVLNNGAYKVGYKIFSSDTSTIVYEPPNNGVRFQFDVKPSNSWVNTVFFRPLSSTSSHTYQVTNNISSDNFWNSAGVPQGDYVVMVFAEDTRANTDTAYVRVTTTEADLEAPGQPVMRQVSEDPNGIRIAWYPSPAADLTGYRLYFSLNNIDWALFRNEAVLTPSVTDTVIRQTLNRDMYFYVSAVDDAPVPNESVPSDVYGMSNGTFDHKVLVVDGFDRTDGGWNQARHDFAFAYGSTLVAHDVSFDTAPNEALLDSSVTLDGYDAVIWFLGDEMDSTEAFSAAEQAHIRAFLEGGGNLMVSGANVAYDLDPASGGGASSDDLAFLNNYLKIGFAGAAAGAIGVAGVAGTLFDGMLVGFGQTPYAVASPDVFTIADPSAAAILEYGTGQVAAIRYEGTFGAGTDPGKLVVMAPPFETIDDTHASREAVMARILSWMLGVTAIEPPAELAGVPGQFVMNPLYPNPFNPSTTVRFGLPAPSRVTIAVYDVLGRNIAGVLREEPLPGGWHEITLDGRDDAGRALPSGLYLVRLTAESDGRSVTLTRKAMLVK